MSIDGRSPIMWRWIVTLILCATMSASTAQAGKILRDISRVKGQGASMIQGLGLVVGLNGTGDSGSELAMARPLAAALTNMGNPVSIDELESTNSAALVLVTCHIPRDGAKSGDELEITISVINSAQSLKGGILLMTPLSPRPNSPVYAFANGRLHIPEEDNPTVAVDSDAAPRSSATSTRCPPSLDPSIIIIDSSLRRLGTRIASMASEIDQNYRLSSDRLGEPLARVINPRTIRVTVPHQRTIQSRIILRTCHGNRHLRRAPQTPSTSYLRHTSWDHRHDRRCGSLPNSHHAQRPRSSPRSLIRSRMQHCRWTQSSQHCRPNSATQTTDSTTAKLQDLIAAFDQLDVPPIEQIQILKLIHKAGKLHARLIIDGVG